MVEKNINKLKTDLYCNLKYLSGCEPEVKEA